MVEITLGIAISASLTAATAAFFWWLMDKRQPIARSSACLASASATIFHLTGMALPAIACSLVALVILTGAYMAKCRWAAQNPNL